MTRFFSQIKIDLFNFFNLKKKENFSGQDKNDKKMRKSLSYFQNM